jgi:hypothetical protein
MPEGYTVNDRRGGANPEPAEVCRVCGCSVVHAREYNKPTMGCIEYLRGLAAKAETLRLGEEPARTFPRPLTADEINTMDLAEACSQITNRVYTASLLFEQLEHRGAVSGNGHHAAQQVAAFAEKEMRERWRTSPRPTTETK